METFDAYLHILAPYNTKGKQKRGFKKAAIRSQSQKAIQDIYFDRIGNRSLKRTLCQFPTSAAAQRGRNETLKIMKICLRCFVIFMTMTRSAHGWKSEKSTKIVDYLNGAQTIIYKMPKSDIQFSVVGRTWINSDGRNNMPSGEVYTSPVEDSVNGFIHFDLPTVYNGHQVRGVTLHVKDGFIESWSVEEGKAF